MTDLDQKRQSQILAGEKNLTSTTTPQPFRYLATTFRWDVASPECPRSTNTTFFPTPISAMRSCPHKRHRSCSSPARCQIAATDLCKRLQPQGQTAAAQRVGGSCETPAVSMLQLCQLPANFQTKHHTIGLPCVVLTVCSTSFVFFLPFSSTFFPPPLPPLQSVGSPKLDIPCCESDGAAGRVCSRPEPQLCDSLDALATKLSICEYSKHAARPVSLSTLKTGNISSSLRCH